MRREVLYLADIIEAIDHIADFTGQSSFEAFEHSEMLRSAVIQKLAVIGEAASRISQDLKSRHPEVPWFQIVAFRNILIHAYFGIDANLVWLTAKGRCPTLRGSIAGILETEFGEAV